MKNWRENSWIPLLPVAALLGLLVLLAFLQYSWLGQISAGERERLQKRLQTDTQRFAEDFNREIGTAYFTFQLNSENLQEKDFATFNQRLNDWRESTAFPALIADFYFVRNDEISIYNVPTKLFVPTDWTTDFAELREQIKQNIDLGFIDGKRLTLILPIYETGSGIIFRKQSSSQITDKVTELPLQMPEKFGFLVLKLDENTIKNELLPALAQRYFSDSESANFKLAVVRKSNESDIVFASNPEVKLASNISDASVSLFDSVPENFTFLVNRVPVSRPRVPQEKNSTVVLTQRFESKTITHNSTNSNQSGTITVRTAGGSKSPRILAGNTELNNKHETGLWLLLVQHSAGSLEQFITNTQRKNLAVSFGILTLLAVSVVLIFLSARRSKFLAQKQLDFVSAVSHEFRTPLAVIYSASENLTDGVVNSEKQVVQYGNLIKGEGKKLSAMVEQILEFAGARSGQKKYNFSEINIAEVLENAFAECQPLIEEKGFTVEKNIAENLPNINADANALSHAIQNLINNSIKYDSGKKFLKISTENGNDTLKIVVEDKGIGISAKEIPDIFTPFFRGKNVVEAQIHGNGLGLSLVKQTVEAHGGNIKVESEAGKGSRFTIQLSVISHQSTVTGYKKIVN